MTNDTLTNNSLAINEGRLVKRAQLLSAAVVDSCAAFRLVILWTHIRRSVIWIVQPICC